MAWNNRLSVLLIAFLVLPVATPSSELLVGPAAGGSDAGETLDNVSIATPAFLQLSLWWDDGGARFTALDLDEFDTRIGDSAGDRHIHENPIPVMHSETIRVRIYGKSSFPGGILYDINYTSGAAGSYRVLTVRFDTGELAAASMFFPVRVIFRPYDSATGSGLPVEAFNITIQFPGDLQCSDEGCVFAGAYAAGPEIPIGLGYVDTYYGLNMTVRVRDYFGNLEYNQTRRLRFDNSTICSPTTGGASSSECGLLTSNFLTWDIPLSVHSFKVYNQKPDQFIKVKLFWNGTSAGEEVFAPNSGLTPAWWDSAYTYRERLVAPSQAEVPKNCSFNVSVDLASLVAASKVAADYRDLRVVWWDGAAWHELNRTIVNGQFVRYAAQVDYINGTSTYPEVCTPNGAWRFEETAGSTAYDNSSYGNPGTISGATSTTGKVGLGYSFDGVNDKVTVANSASIDLIGSSVTMSAWINPASSGFRQIFEMSNSTTFPGGRKLGLFLDGSNNLGCEIRTDGGGFVSTVHGSVTNSVWSHVACTYDGTTVRWVINGVQTGTEALTGTIVSTPSQTFDIGVFRTVSWFNGLIDEPRLYSYARTNENLVEDMTLTRPRGALPDRQYWLYYGNPLAGAAAVANVTAKNATAQLDAGTGFEWFQSPGETVERFLNPGFYEIQIVTDNRTGIQTKANLGFTVSEANYLMVSGTNITRFIGDFRSIFTQTQIIKNAFMPDVIEYGELLPTVPTQIHPMSLDEEAILVHPFSVLTGTAVYIGAAGTNVTSYMPDFESASSTDGALLKDIRVKQDTFIFSAAEPTLTHIWINYTSNGTNIWESSTVPPSVVLLGIASDVYVVSNRTLQTTRMSNFEVVWEFHFAYYATTKRYEAAITLNNSMNRTVFEPYWRVGFPTNRSINITSAAVKDLDNNVWLTAGQHFTTSQDGYYMTFQQLNASTERSFFFQFFDLNSTEGQSTLIRQVSEISRETFAGSTAYWVGEASFSHDFAAPYRGDLVVKLTCSECQRIKWETVVVEDLTGGRILDATEFLAGGGSVTISSSSFGELGVGEVRNYKIHFQLQLDPANSDFSVFQALIIIAGVGISLFLIIFGASIVSAVAWAFTKEKKAKATYFAALVFFGFTTMMMWVGRAGGGLGFVP